VCLEVVDGELELEGEAALVDAVDFEVSALRSRVIC